ncbi:DUF3592 domain-containing protein [Actinospongicola halichondriae]|uniref:DUF3592 domain-containing protein n=1 Tax=Actinospongicola halichondriae TaxID=3236844 RepID=UPI003D59F7F8
MTLTAPIIGWRLDAALRNRHSPAMADPSRWSRWRRPTVRRGITFIALGMLTLVAAGFLLGPASDRQDALVQAGVEVPGVVTKSRDPIRGPSSVEFRYSFNGRDFDGEIFGSNSYDAGEAVAVFVDPDDPASATLAKEQPQSRPAYVLTLVMITGSFLLLAAGVADLWKRWRRSRV